MKLTCQVLGPILLVLLTMSGCGDSSVPVPNYYPTTLNSSWTYSVTTGQTSVTTVEVITASTGSVISRTTTVSGSTEYSLFEYAKLDTTAWAEIQMTKYDSNGILQLSTTYTPPVPITPSNWNIGTHDVVSGVLSQSDGISYSYTQEMTVSGFEAVAVPAGSFANALKVQFDVTLQGTSSTATLWYVDGIGIVKGTYASGSLSVTRELVSYRIK